MLALLALVLFMNWSHPAMKLSAIGRAALESREGVRLQAYRDSKGIWTIGVGHTASCGAPIPKAGLRITAEEADACFARDVARFERAIAAELRVPVAEHEFDALVSLAFNVGEAGAAHSTAVRKLNAGDRPGAAAAILLWNKPAEILDRRRAEADQFLTPYAKALPKGRRSDKAPVRAPGPISENKPSDVVEKIDIPRELPKNRNLVAAAAAQPAPQRASFWAVLGTGLSSLFTGKKA
jgi:lysozyme